jgi:hypothetical protein
MPEAHPILSVNVADLPWRPSTVASGVFVKDIAVTDGWEMQLVRAGRRMGPGWASVAGAGTIDEDVNSETGCVFVLVDQA